MVYKARRVPPRITAPAVLVPTIFATHAILDIIPNPGDIGYFYVERWLQQNSYNPKYWTYKVINYYAWDSAWYAFVAAVAYFTGKTFTDKIRNGVGAVSLGVIAYLLWRYSQNSQHTASAPTPIPGGAMYCPMLYSQYPNAKT